MEDLKILVLDDEPDFRSLLVDSLNDLKYITFSAASPSQAFETLRHEHIDIALVDIFLPEMSGIEVIERMRHSSPKTATIAITGNGDVNTVIETLRAGGTDFLRKPFGLNDLNNSINRIKASIDKASKREKSEFKFHHAAPGNQLREGLEIVGVSSAMKKVMMLVSKVAETDATSVLITGESGTGKELVAQSIHALSRRNNNLFHCVNCSVIPETLFESEFFGHKKGAFTGATESTMGWFELSHNSTLFLDEIGELPFSMQSKLLRVLDDKTITRIGTNKMVSLDLRIISATNQNLNEMVKEKKFRNDLYHRLNSFRIHIPPLRERREDIPELTNYFVNHFSGKMNKKICELDESFRTRLYMHDFPGNVRELKNMIESAFIVCDGDVLRARHLGVHKHKPHNYNVQRYNGSYNLRENERDMIHRALQQSGNQKSKAAAILNITRQSLYRKIEKFGIRVEEEFLFT
jgi:DNA-binding NtrC family response regulator